VKGASINVTRINGTCTGSIDKLRPFLIRDGGDCELVDVEDGIVKLRLLGACGTCTSSTITLKAGIERALLEEVPGVVEVEQVF